MVDVQHEIMDASMLRADKDFWSIYDSSFPPDETEPHDVFYRALDQGSGLIVRSTLEGKTVAMASCQVLKEVPALFLAYIAVAPSLQSKGAGGLLFEHLVQLGMRNDPALWGVVWEIERIESVCPPSDTHQRARRARFFERHNGRIIDADYVQPALNGVRPVPMSLVYRPINHPCQDDQALAQALTHAIYYDKYWMVNGIPPSHLESLLALRQQGRELPPSMYSL